MGLSKEDEQELKSIIRSSVERFAGTINDEISEEELLEKDYTSVSNQSKRSITQPSRHMASFSLRQSEFFEDVTNKLKQKDLLFNLDDDTVERYKINTDKLERESYHNELVDSIYQNEIFHFSWKVLDYSGGFYVNDDVFNEAFKTHYLSKYDSIEKYRIIIPVYNLTVNSTNTSLRLFSETDIFERDDYYHDIESLEIKKMPENIKNGIILYHNSSVKNLENETVDKCDCAIVANVISTNLENTPLIPGIEIGKRVLTAIRLDNSGSIWHDKMEFKSVYFTKKSWFEYRTNVPEITNSESYSRGNNIEVTDDSVEYRVDSEFCDFWENYCELIRFDPDWPLSGALRRYNEMHRKHYPEDKILDCLIACEGLLLRSGGVVKSSITSSLKLYASLLLDGRTHYSRKEIRDIFMELYRIRGKIVHENNTVNQILADNDFEELPNNVEQTMGLAQEMLASVIRAYLHEKLVNERSVGKVNDLMQESINTAAYPPNG